MDISIPDCFIISFFIGLIFGLVYEVLRIIRVTFPFRIIIFICDILFFVLSAEAIMVISEVMGNYIRIYTILGFGSGVFSYIVTIGRILNILENAAANAWQNTIKKFTQKIVNIFKQIFSKISHKVNAVVSKNAEYFHVKMKNCNQDLKSSDEMLYNDKGLEKIGGRKNVIKASVRKNT